MPNHNQAPILSYRGDKMTSNEIAGFAQRSHDLEKAIMTGLGPQDTAQLKIMFALTANAEGFACAEKTILERTGLAHKTYVDNRKKLIEKGWLILDEKKLIVNVEKILNPNTSIFNDPNTSIKNGHPNTAILIDPNTAIIEKNINPNTSILVEGDDSTRLFAAEWGL